MIADIHTEEERIETQRTKSKSPTNRNKRRQKKNEINRNAF